MLTTDASPRSREINWDYVGDSVPAFLTLIIIPLTYKYVTEFETSRDPLLIHLSIALHTVLLPESSPMFS